jgi:hypothetical protein
MSGLRDSNSASHMATSDSCTPPWAVICVNMLVWKRFRNRCTSYMTMRSTHCDESRAALGLVSLCCIEGGGIPIPEAVLDGKKSLVPLRRKGH